MKRGRVNDAGDEEPLAKKINNLHLDPYHQMNSQSSMNGVDPCLYNPINGNVHTPYPSNPIGEGHGSLYNSNHANGIQQGHYPNSHMHPPALHPNIAQAHQSHQSNQSNEDYPMANDNTTSAPSRCSPSEQQVQEMIRQRQLPESVQLHYPATNPTSNENYYGVNKVLHELHLERLAREGKLRY